MWIAEIQTLNEDMGPNLLYYDFLWLLYHF